MMMTALVMSGTLYAASIKVSSDDPDFTGPAAKPTTATEKATELAHRGDFTEVGDELVANSFPSLDALSVWRMPSTNISSTIPASVFIALFGEKPSSTWTSGSAWTSAPVVFCLGLILGIGLATCILLSGYANQFFSTCIIESSNGEASKTSRSKPGMAAANEDRASEDSSGDGAQQRRVSGTTMLGQSRQDRVSSKPKHGVDDSWQVGKLEAWSTQRKSDTLPQRNSQASSELTKGTADSSYKRIDTSFRFQSFISEEGVSPLVRTSATPNQAEPSPSMLSEATKEIGFTDEFQVTSTYGDTASFCWMTPSEASTAGLPHATAPMLEDTTSAEDQRRECGEITVPIPAPWSVEAVRQALSENGIKVAAWDDDKLQNLANELISGKTFLVISQQGELRRTAEILTVVVQAADNSGQVIVCDDDGVADSNEHMDSSEPIPSIWFSPTTESIKDAAQRCLKLKLGLPEGAVNLQWGKVKSFMEEDTFPSYPGLTTVVRRMIVVGTMENHTEAGASDLNRRFKKVVHNVQTIKSVTGGARYPQIGSPRGQNWTWKKHSQVPSLARTKLHSSLTFFKDEFSYVLLPWTPSEVKSVLECHGAQAEVDFDMSLDELSLKASQGELTFGVCNGQLRCVQDVVQLRVVSSQCHAVLVQMDGIGPQWPCTTRQLGESCWDAAYRSCSTSFRLDGACVRIGFTSLAVPEDEMSRICSRLCVFTAHLRAKRESKCAVIHGDKV